MLAVLKMSEAKDNYLEWTKLGMSCHEGQVEDV
jgi:hypothetical protein